MGTYREIIISMWKAAGIEYVNGMDLKKTDNFNSE